MGAYYGWVPIMGAYYLDFIACKHKFVLMTTSIRNEYYIAIPRKQQQQPKYAETVKTL